jgi:hypothetical protein
LDIEENQTKTIADKLIKEMEQCEEKLFGMQINTSRNQ